DAPDGVGASLLLGVHAYQDAIRGTNRERAVANAENALIGLRQHIHELYWSPASGLVIHALFLGDGFAAASQTIEDLVLISRRSGSALAFSTALMWRAELNLATGVLVDAEADARLAFDAQSDEEMAGPWRFAALAQILVERDALAQAARILERFGGEVDSFRENNRQHAFLFRARGRVASARGDHRAALADALAAGRIAGRFGVTNPA